MSRIMLVALLALTVVSVGGWKAYKSNAAGDMSGAAPDGRIIDHRTGNDNKKHHPDRQPDVKLLFDQQTKNLRQQAIRTVW